MEKEEDERGINMQSLKTETYIPRRYRKYHARVFYEKGRFYPRYVVGQNIYIMPNELARLIANKIRDKGISADDLRRQRYHTYVVYKDEERTVFTITDKYGNMITMLTIPNTVYEYLAAPSPFHAVRYI